MKIAYFPNRAGSDMTRALQDAFEIGFLKAPAAIDTPKLLPFLNADHTAGEKPDVILIEIDYNAEKINKVGRNTVQSLNEAFGGQPPSVFILETSDRALKPRERHTLHNWFPESAIGFSRDGWVKVIPALCEAADQDPNYEIRDVPDRYTRFGNFVLDSGRPRFIKLVPRADDGTNNGAGSEAIGRQMESLSFALKRKTPQAIKRYFEAGAQGRSGYEGMPSIELTAEENAFLFALARNQGENMHENILLQNIYGGLYPPPAERLEMLYMMTQEKLEKFGAKAVLGRDELLGTYRAFDIFEGEDFTADYD